MNSDATGNYILDQYRKVSGKLKKRFRRKPNISEACESFCELGQYCENEQLPSYAGLCWIATAQCEGSLTNIPGETASLRRAARQFLAAEKGSHSLGCVTPCQENLHAALSCYAHAIMRYPKNQPMLSTNISLEIIEAFTALHQADKWESYLKSACSSILNNDSCQIETHLLCMELLGNYHIRMGDYASALDIYTKIGHLIGTTFKNAAHRDTLLMCEINQILLVLILRPVPQSVSPILGGVLEKYTWNEEMHSTIVEIGMNHTLFLLLQSLVLNCQSTDSCIRSNLAQLETELWQHLNADQKCLLRVLLQLYS